MLNFYKIIALHFEVTVENFIYYVIGHYIN